MLSASQPAWLLFLCSKPQSSRCRGGDVPIPQVPVSHAARGRGAIIEPIQCSTTGLGPSIRHSPVSAQRDGGTLVVVRSRKDLRICGRWEQLAITSGPRQALQATRQGEGHGLADWSYRTIQGIEIGPGAREGNDMDARRRQATLRDVAAAAAVSLGTASHALNDSPLIRPETRARVHEAARRLGYAPHRNYAGAARALG